MARRPRDGGYCLLVSYLEDASGRRYNVAKHANTKAGYRRAHHHHAVSVVDAKGDVGEVVQRCKDWAGDFTDQILTRCRLVPQGQIHRVRCTRLAGGPAVLRSLRRGGKGRG